MSGPKQYEFYGTATVSVQCFIEADSEEQAWEMLNSGDCAWECDEVDGDVQNIELCGPEDDEEEE